MATDVLMPQMGESITEGTVSRWIKKVGDKVERDEPLLEISTDKVDAEIPSPAAGTLTEVLVKEGQTVAVNSVVARIAAEGEAAAASKPAAAEKPKAAPPEKPKPAAPEVAAAPQKAAAAPPPTANRQPTTDNLTSLEERRRTKSSPLVRKIAKENNVDIAQIQGSGVSGRVTKNDILEFLQQPREAAAAPAREARAAPPQFAPGE